MLRSSSMLALAFVASAEAGALCDAVKIDRLPVCVEGAGGIVLAGEESEAAAIRDSIELARPNFAAAFGREAPRYAIIFDSPSAEEVAQVKAAGFPAVLPWLSKAVLEAQVGEKIRAALRENIPGMSQEQEDAIVAENIARMSAKMPAHEIGHLWFDTTFWPGFAGDSSHYGGPAPDWMDETAAILMESGPLADNRRISFKSVWTGGQGVAPLADFLTMEHPAKAELEAASSGGGPEGRGPSVAVVPANQGPNDKTAIFYAQVAAFSDFLIAQSGNSSVFGKLAESIVRGETIEDWLASQGPKNNLAADLPGLQALWEAWATKTHGAKG